MLLSDGTPTAEDAIEAIGADVPETDAEVAEPVGQPAATTSAKPETPTPATPRDERGRFAEKPSTPAPEPSSPEAAVPAETPAEPTAPDAAAAAEEETSYPEATYRADGQDFTIPGSAVGDDGVFNTTDVWQREILPLLAAGRAARGGSLQRTLQDKSREVQSWQQQAQAAQAQSQAIIAKIDQMVENGTIGQWLEDVHQQWPIMKAQAEASALRLQQQAAQQQLQAFQAEQQQRQMEPQFTAALENSLTQIGPQFDLTPEQLAGLFQQLNTPAMRQTWLVRAQYDDPMSGVRAGEWAIDTSVVQQWAQWASQYQPRQKAPAVPPKVAEAQKQNAKKTPAAPPPVVGGKGGSAPSGKPNAPKYKDGKEALARIFDDEEFQNFEVEE